MLKAQQNKSQKSHFRWEGTKIEEKKGGKYKKKVITVRRAASKLAKQC